MATVRLTKELRTYILSKAKDQVRPAISRAEQLEPSGPEWGDKVYKTIFQHELAIIEQAPGNWFKYRTDICIKDFLPGDYRDLTLKLSAPVRWPETIIENEFIKPGTPGTWAGVYKKPHPAWDELIVAYTAYREVENAAREKASMYVKSVEKIIETYSTLAPALKAWAPLWDLLPATTQAEHHRINTPRKRGEQELDVDFDTLTSISTAAKFGI